MDIETLTNNISGLGKAYFEIACKIVLQEAFNLRIINVDGKNDGGTDFISFSDTGERIDAAYQITTQKTDIKNKAYKDAKKTIEKLNVRRFYFLTTYLLDETEARKLENTISTDLDISCTCLSARAIAGLILSENLLNKFLDETNQPLPRGADFKPGYNEMALHSYTLFSDDATKLKAGIYDDTLLYILSTNDALDLDSLIRTTVSFLDLNSEREDQMTRRIDSLLAKGLIKKTADNKIELTAKSKDDLNSRKTLYEIELSSLSSAQVDIMWNEFNLKWSEEDSKKVALWIANAFVADQITNLKEAKASIISNPLFGLENNGLDRLKKFLSKEKKVDKDKVDNVVEKLLDNASNHPLITKLSRASVYLALEGANPISSAKALGANRWSSFNILVEPTVAIPCICAQLYRGKVNRYFDNAIEAIKQAQTLGAKLYIPFFYINECAGHLLAARRYDHLGENSDVLSFSSNAFVANYNALKEQGVALPDSFMEYLASFSPAIKIQRANVKDWTRAIMTDIQSVLIRSGIEFIDVPFYNPGDCDEFEKELMFSLKDIYMEKKSHLFDHDLWALQFSNDNITKHGEHWILLTYDRALINISKGSIYKGWITNPFKFLDFTAITKPLSEAKLISLVHSVATFSEQTLSASARIIDRVVRYASNQMQDWQFKQEIERFREEMIQQIDLDTPNSGVEIDKRTDEFLKQHGVKDLTDEIEAQG